MLLYTCKRNKKIERHMTSEKVNILFLMNALPICFSL